MKKTKYGVSKKSERTYNGTTYMSKLEMRYRVYLDKLRTCVNPEHRVINIVEQKPYPIFINGKLICKYLLDFEVTYDTNPRRVELIDVKGAKTAMYSLKKKAVEAYYGIKIKEIKKGQF